MRAVAVLASFAALLLNWPESFAAGHSKILWPNPIEIFQGELAEVSVIGADIAVVEGGLGKEKIFFYPIGTAKFSAIIGADVDAKAGTSKLRLIARTRGGGEIRAEVPVKTRVKSFRHESFNVPPGFDQMTPENLEEVRREQAAFTRAFAAPAPDRLWDAPFIRPVPQQESASSFGRRRIINGTPRAPHSGVDLSAPAGTEVAAANHGKVVLNGDFFFAGRPIWDPSE